MQKERVDKSFYYFEDKELNNLMKLLRKFLFYLKEHTIADSPINLCYELEKCTGNLDS